MDRGGRVLAGIDRIGEPEFEGLFRGRRVGVVSAASGLSSDYRFPIDILNEKYLVTGIFAPEHGPRGIYGPGEEFSGGTDVCSGLPVYSLYDDLLSADAAEAKERISNTDVMVFDMQDAGSRYFTYVTVMYRCMQFCAAAGVPFVVLDRPNPLGGYVEGNVLDPAYSSAIGLTEVPIRHGMTVGELACFYNGKYGLGCDLTVVPLSGWSRDMYFDDTGLPFVRPSPNLPTFESVLVYNGTCLFEGTNVSVGRGTAVPFTTIGAEYIDPLKLADSLNGDESLEGVRFSPAFFRPMYMNYEGKKLYGVTLHVTDKRKLRAVRVGVTILRTIEAMYPQFEYRMPSKPGAIPHFDLAAGSSELRTSGLSAGEIISKWDAESEAWAEENSKYLLY